MTSYVPEGNINAIKDHSKIFRNYYSNGSLKLDVITEIPIVFVLDNSYAKFYRLLFLIKVCRLKRVFETVSVSAVIHEIQVRTMNRKLSKIEADPTLGEDTLTDHNNVNFLMNVSHSMKIVELVILILNISYFVGILFMIVAELNMKLERLINEDDYSDYFIEYFEIESLDYSS